MAEKKHIQSSKGTNIVQKLLKEAGEPTVSPVSVASIPDERMSILSLEENAGNIIDQTKFVQTLVRNKSQAEGVEPLPNWLCGTDPFVEQGDNVKTDVLCIYSGGTLGMKKHPKTGVLEPSTISLETYVTSGLNPTVPDDDNMPYLHFISIFDPPLDSSDIGPAQWSTIANTIRDNYEKYSGFVIIHGTDTMAYTATALSFMLENLSKTVVLTGSQIPLQNPRSDGKSNLIDSILTAAHSGVPEVVIVFAGKMLRGNRSTKVNAWGLSAFDSPNSAPLGTSGLHLTVNCRRVRLPPPPTAKLVVRDCICSDVLVVWVYPGISGVLDSLLSSENKVKGIILVSFGTGAIPSNTPEFIKALQKLLETGIIVAIVSQCSVGTVILNAYKNAHEIQKMGAISGFDMTVEAAFVKLSWLLGQGYSGEEISR